MGRNPKYFVSDGRTIKQYCEETPGAPNLDTVKTRIRCKHWSPDKAVSEPVVKGRNFVHGVPFRQFCIQHGLNYPNLYMKWLRLTKYNKVHKKNGLTIEQFADDILKGVEYEFDTTDYYGRSYCRSRGLNYESMYQNWNHYHSDKCTFKEYVDLKIAQKTIKDLDHMYVSDYCKMKGYNLGSIRNKYAWYKRNGGGKCLKDFVRQWEKDNGKGGETT